MGNFSKTLTAAAVSSAILLSGCSKVFDDDSSRPTPALPSAVQADPSTINVLIVDENDDLISGTTTLLVRNTDGSATGGDAGRLALAGTSTAANSFTVKNGLAALTLANKADKLSTDPLDVIFVGQGDGFFRSSNRVSFNEDSDQFLVIVKLTRSNPAAISASKAIVGAAKTISATNGTDSSGLTKTAVSIATTPRAASTGTAEVKGTTDLSIPTGTKLVVTDANGVEKTAAAGGLTLNVAYFENNPSLGDSTFNSNASSLGAFPGGLNVQADDVDTSGTAFPDRAIRFSSAGFASIELKDSQGNLVTKFQDSSGNPRPITINMTIPEGTPNPEAAFDTSPANGKIDAGERVPVWSYNELTGKWKREVDSSNLPVSAPVTDSNTSDGLLNVSFTTTHLSYFNLDYRGDRCTNAGGQTSSAFQIVDANGAANNLPYAMQVFQTAGGWQDTMSPAKNSNSLSNVTFRGPPAFTNMQLELRPSINSTTQIASKFELAGGTTITADASGRIKLGATRTLCDLDGGKLFTNQSNPVSVTVNFELVKACTEDDSRTTPYPTAAYLYKDGKFLLTLATTQTGSATRDDLLEGGSYSWIAYNKTSGTFTSQNAFTPQDSSAEVTQRVIVEREQCDPDPGTGGGTPTGATGSTGSTGG